MSEIKRILYSNMSADHVAVIGMTAKADTIERSGSPSEKERAYLRDYEKNIVKYMGRVKGSPDQQRAAKQKAGQQLREYIRKNPNIEYWHGLTGIELHAVNALL